MGNRALSTGIPHADRAGRIRSCKDIVGARQSNSTAAHRATRHGSGTQRNRVIVRGNRAHTNRHCIHADGCGVRTGRVRMEVLRS